AGVLSCAGKGQTTTGEPKVLLEFLRQTAKGGSLAATAMLKRILKTLAALGAGHGVQTLTQLLLPPAFIAAYGVKGYGEWLALSAAVGYLGTLDFGLQTYVLNRLTGLYHRGEFEEFRRVQSVGLWLTLGFVAIGTTVACLAFVLPLSRW